MRLAESLDIRAEVAAIVAALDECADPVYEWGMRRTVPSSQPAHAVRVPGIRRLAAEWSRRHKELPPDQVVALAEALWQTGWREERILAMAIVGRSKQARSALTWETIERWSAGIDNWELVDNMAGHLAGPMLVSDPERASRVQLLSGSGHVWQRRLAVVTLIEAARDDGAWQPHLRSMVEQLKDDRGPTMRKAVDWARRTLEKLELKGPGGGVKGA